VNLFTIIVVQKVIEWTSFGDILLNEFKQKKPFVLLNDEIAKAWHLPLVV